MSNNPAQRIRLAWRISTTSYMCLLGVLLIWHFRILPVPLPTAIAMVAPLAIPLLIAGPGIFNGKSYTYKWMSLVVWIWFAHGAMEAWTHLEVPVLAGVAALESLLSVTLFVGMVMFLKAQRALQA